MKTKPQSKTIVEVSQTVTVTINGTAHEMTRAEAGTLHSALSEALGRKAPDDQLAELRKVAEAMKKDREQNREPIRPIYPSTPWPNDEARPHKPNPWIKPPYWTPQLGDRPDWENGLTWCRNSEGSTTVAVVTQLAKDIWG